MRGTNFRLCECEWSEVAQSIQDLQERLTIAITDNWVEISDPPPSVKPHIETSICKPDVSVTVSTPNDTVGSPLFPKEIERNATG